MVVLEGVTGVRRKVRKRQKYPHCGEVNGSTSLPFKRHLKGNATGSTTSRLRRRQG